MKRRRVIFILSIISLIVLSLNICSFAMNTGFSTSEPDEKSNKKEKVGKKGPVKSQENNQGHTAQVKKIIERSLINNEKIMDVKQLE